MKENESRNNQSTIFNKSDLGDDLCKYCILEKKGAYGVDGGFMARGFHYTLSSQPRTTVRGFSLNQNLCY